MEVSTVEKPKRAQTQTQTWNPKIEGQPSPEARRKARRLVLQAGRQTDGGGRAAEPTADTSRQSA